MQLKDSEIAWAPQEKPDYLLVLRKGQSVPTDLELFLFAQADLLKRLVREASPAEIRGGNLMLDLLLPQEVLVWLPPGLLDDPSCPQQLLMNPAPLGSPLCDWQEGIEEALQLPPMSPEEARQAAEELNLEVFLDRIL